MKTNRQYCIDFVIKQKCIPWKVHNFFRKLGVSIFGKYNKDFFDSKHRIEVKDTCVHSIVSTLISKYKPKTVLDIGCGDGIYLEEFNKNGIETFGLENSKEGVKRCKKKKINVKRFNIIKHELAFTRKYDLVICFEVAEHLPAYTSDRLIDLISKLGKIIAFTAAPPGQGGTGHINEQPKSYWINKFEERGYVVNTADTEELKKLWNEAEVIKYMASNLLIFKSS